MQIFRRSKAFVSTARHAAATVARAILTILSVIFLFWCVLIFAFSMVVKAGREGFETTCYNGVINNTGNSGDVCVPLSLFGGNDVFCNGFNQFCDDWEHQMQIDTFIVGACFLIAASTLYLMTQVANYMRVRHNITDDLYKVEVSNNAPAATTVTPH